MIKIINLHDPLIMYYVNKPYAFGYSMRVQSHPDGDYYSIEKLRGFQKRREEMLEWMQQEFGKIKHRWGWASQGDWCFDVGFQDKADMMLFRLRWS